MFDYFDSMSAIMKMIRQSGIVVSKSNLFALIELKAIIRLNTIVYKPIRLYLYVPP